MSKSNPVLKFKEEDVTVDNDTLNSTDPFLNQYGLEKFLSFDALYTLEDDSIVRTNVMTYCSLYGEWRECQEFWKDNEKWIVGGGNGYLTPHPNMANYKFYYEQMGKYGKILQSTLVKKQSTESDNPLQGLLT